MSRRQRRNSNNNGSMSATTILIAGVVAAVVVAFILAYVLYANKLSKESRLSTNVEKISSSGTTNMLNVITNAESSQVSTSIGKSVNEVQNESTNTSKENTEKMAVNTSAIENTTTSTKNTQESSTKNETSQENEIDEETTESADPTFIKPVDGDVIKDYASDTLVYSNTLEEWTTHLGIDFAAEKTSIVKASADGTVKSIKNDPRYGLTVVLEHSDGFTSMYSSLLSTEFITVGETVTQGQTIATVGNTATFEIADETHLHFEILKDGVNVDPNIYLK